MIAYSRKVLLSAFVIATGLHLGGVIRFGNVELIEIEGGQQGATEASLGDAFADLTQSSIASKPVEQSLEPIEPKTTPPTPDAPETTKHRAIETQTAPPTPRQSSNVPPDTTQSPVHRQLSAADPEATPPAPLDSSDSPPETAQTPEPTLRTTPNVTPSAAPTTQLAALTPKRPEPAPSTTVSSEVVEKPITETAERSEPEALTAQEPDRIDVTTSLRPKARRPELEKPAEPKKAQREVRRTESPEIAGNSNRNATAGQSDGSATVTQAQKSAKQNGSAQAGNARASNYSGQVMRKIQRVRRPRVGSRGTATVAFSIATNGGLSGLSVLRSSGSPTLDKAAMLVIQRAAPFPAPPQGARRSFSIEIKGR